MFLKQENVSFSRGWYCQCLILLRIILLNSLCHGWDYQYLCWESSFCWSSSLTAVTISIWLCWESSFCWTASLMANTISIWSPLLVTLTANHVYVLRPSLFMHNDIGNVGAEILLQWFQTFFKLLTPWSRTLPYHLILNFKKCTFLVFYVINTCSRGSDMAIPRLLNWKPLPLLHMNISNWWT